MGDFQNEIGGVASQFATISARAVAEQNAARLRVAEGNIAAGQAQIDLEQTAQRREIARSLAQHNGQIAASAALRGVGAGGLGTSNQIALSASLQAGEQVALVAANAAAKEAQLIAGNQVILEDPFLAAIQGAMQGIQIGTQLADAAMAGGRTRSTTFSEEMSGGFGIPHFSNIVDTFFETEGFDFASLLEF